MTYLYQHIREDNGDVFYVGIGDIKRPYSKSKRTKHWYNIVNKHGYKVEVVRSFDTWEEACEWEKLFISIYGKRLNNSGSLVNITDGGEGALGRTGELHPFYGKKRPEHSVALKGRKSIQTSIRMSGENHFFYGKKRPESHGIKISNSKRGKCSGENNAFYGKTHSKESISKMSEKAKKKIIKSGTGEIAFDSLKEASKELGIKETTLSAMLRGKNKNYTGYEYFKAHKI